MPGAHCSQWSSVARAAASGSTYSVVERANAPAKTAVSGGQQKAVRQRRPEGERAPQRAREGGARRAHFGRHHACRVVPAAVPEHDAEEGEPSLPPGGPQARVRVERLREVARRLREGSVGRAPSPGEMCPRCARARPEVCPRCARGISGASSGVGRAFAQWGCGAAAAARTRAAKGRETRSISTPAAEPTTSTPRTLSAAARATSSTRTTARATPSAPPADPASASKEEGSAARGSDEGSAAAASADAAAAAAVAAAVVALVGIEAAEAE